MANSNGFTLWYENNWKRKIKSEIEKKKKRKENNWSWLELRNDWVLGYLDADHWPPPLAVAIGHTGRDEWSGNFMESPCCTHEICFSLPLPSFFFFPFITLSFFSALPLQIKNVRKREKNKKKHKCVQVQIQRYRTDRSCERNKSARKKKKKKKPGRRHQLFHGSPFPKSLPPTKPST